MFKVPENFRNDNLLPDHPYFSEHGELHGLFLIPTQIKEVFLFIIATNGDWTIPWEHISVSLKKITKGKSYEIGRCPTWEEMCRVKDLFWEGTDTVVQFHPPESEYVSQHHHCLHLWRKKGINFETPPSITVGTTIGQNV